jgi:hypothetical protein
MSGERQAGYGKKRAVQHCCAPPLNPKSRSGNEVNAQSFLSGPTSGKGRKKKRSSTGSAVKMTKKYVHIRVFRHNARVT